MAVSSLPCLIQSSRLHWGNLPIQSRRFPLKKLFQLQPNISQLTFDTTDIDFDSPAQNQLGNLIVGKADDLLWGKKFKVRLTSKKTGKKIDLNITYKLNGE